MNHYRLTVDRDLFFTRAALKHQGRVRVVTLLIDCGSSHMMLAWEALVSLKADPALSKVRRPIATLNGVVYMPEVVLDEFHALGRRVEGMPVLAHSMPPGIKIDGVLGMNFLRRFDTDLNFKQATIRI
jgi:predicted aspartyl protease